MEWLRMLRGLIVVYSLGHCSYAFPKLMLVIANHVPLRPLVQAQHLSLLSSSTSRPPLHPSIIHMHFIVPHSSVSRTMKTYLTVASPPWFDRLTASASTRKTASRRLPLNMAFVSHSQGRRAQWRTPDCPSGSPVAVSSISPGMCAVYTRRHAGPSAGMSW